jgi:hypothetical protein
MNHYTENNNMLDTKKGPLTEAQLKLEQQSNYLLNNNSELWKQLEKQAKLMERTEVEKTELYSRVLNKNKTITLERASVEENKSKAFDLDRELTQLKEIHEVLNTEQQQLQEQLNIDASYIE